jgi:CubicO group peptidase (beta-lactamase class C family)
MRRILVYFFVLLLPLPACEDVSDLFTPEDRFTGVNLLSADQSAGIDQIVDPYLDDYTYISVAVIAGSQIVLTRSYGRDRIGRTDVYASVSKSVTSVIIARLLEEGAITSLDDPISLYSEKYRDVMPEEYKDTPLTFKQLLSHQGGVPHHERIWKNGELALEFRPGTDVMYSTRGYGILGEVISELSGLSYDRLVKTYIGDPVEAGSFSVPNLLFEAPGGLVNSTIQDMARFGLGVMQYDFAGESLMKGLFWYPWSSGEIGLGWYIHHFGTDSLTVYHAGSNGSPRAFLALRPDHQLGITLLGKHREPDGPQQFYMLASELISRIEEFGK